MVGMALSSATLAFCCFGGPSKSRTRRPGLQGAALATEAPLWVPPCTFLYCRPGARTAIVKGTSPQRRLSICATAQGQPTRPESTVYTHGRPPDAGAFASVGAHGRPRLTGVVAR